MTIVFEQIDSTVVTPAVRMETVFGLPGADDNRPFKLLLVGQMTSDGTATADAIVEPTRETQVRGLFGGGSNLARMWQEVKKRWPSAPVACLPMDDPAGDKAAGDITFSGGAATGNGTVEVWVGDNVHVKVAYSTDDTDEETAAAVAAELTAAKQPDLMATVAVNGVNAKKLDVTAKHAGTCGNQIVLRVLFNEEYTLAAAATQPTAGTLALDLADVSAAVKASRRNYIAVDSTDEDNGAIVNQILDQLWNGMTGRPTVAAMGSNAAYADLITLSGLINAKHLMLVGSPAAVTPSWVRAAGALAERMRRDAIVSPADALQWKRFSGWLPAWDAADRLSLEDGEVEGCLQRGITPCVPDDGGVECIVLDLWNEHLRTDGKTTGPQFFTRSGILALRHYRILQRWKRSRFGDVNWQRRVVTSPTLVEVPGGEDYYTSEQSKAFAVMAFDEDKAMERERLLNFVASRGFDAYQHEVVSYELGQVGVACDVFPVPPLVVINAQQRAQFSPPEEEE